MVLNFLECHGFYLNNQMKWTFKSHKGFFVPVIYNHEIKGLRIHLDEKYSLETTDIWFSSGNEYQGTCAQNSIIIFIPNTEKKLNIYNSNIMHKKDINIASEFLLGYRLFCRDQKITIAVPNRITKKQEHDILSNLNINSVEIYIDKHTVSYDCISIYKNLLNNINISREKLNFNFVFDYKDLMIKESINKNISNIA